MVLCIKDSHGQRHWVIIFWGGGSPIEVPIEDVYPQEGFKRADFKLEKGKMITSYDTNGPAGHVSFGLRENGQIGAFEDTFDFNPMGPGVRDPQGRFPIKEWSTKIGSYLPGTPYQMKFVGTMTVRPD